MIRTLRIDGHDIKEIITPAILSDPAKRKIIREECSRLYISAIGADLVARRMNLD